jgi:hypothetical protein
MKSTSLVLGIVAAAVVIVVFLLVFGVSFHRPLPQGAALYDPNKEVLLKGVVSEVRDFSCPVSEGEMGSHLLLQTSDGMVQVHLAPGRVMRSQNFHFSPGERLEVLGSRIPMRMGRADLIAREITRGNESFMFRDPQGKLMLSQ